MTTGLPALIHDVLLGLCVIGAWSVLILYAVLTVAGYVYSRETAGARERRKEPQEWPGVSILVPAHNEEIVVAGTIESLLHLDYPRGRIEIIVIDDSSNDRTRRVIEHLMATDRRLKLVAIPPGLGGKGKSHALNLALRHASHDVLAVYDADNSPEPGSLRYLVAELMADDRLAATVGKVRTLNRATNFLTRCINIEFISFQWMIQAGRWRLFGLASVPGTNYVIRRKALERAGGWDPTAIADDAELTVRLSQEGYRVKFVPYAITWEPEPQHWGVWVRQRLRWARGGTYVVRKFFPRLGRLRRRDLLLEVMHLLTIYHFFFVILIFSDLIFLSGVITGMTVGVTHNPLMVLWALGFALFLLELAIALAIEGEHTPLNLLVAAAMYFTYCQVWVYVCAKAHYLDLVRQERLRWEKTMRVPRTAEEQGR
ncbi:MAG: glycosyltransferase family 2 protein [Armatimonadota bacterium]|nr:MAG: glycosyltransferase family 2 protein [Armatimonadota bacterium]